MKSLKKFMLGMVVLAVSAAPAHAGTQADPEFTDPAGDVFNPLAADRKADWADVVGAWWSPIVDGVRLSVATVGSSEPAEQDVQFYFSWEVLAGQEDLCHSNMYVYATDEGNTTWAGAPRAEMNYTCDDEEHSFTVPILDISVASPGMFSADPFALAATGSVTSVDIPFAAFKEGATPSLYRPGTGLQITSVQSSILLEHFFLPADQPDLCRPSYTPPFDFKSGCPEPARVYVIE